MFLGFSACPVKNLGDGIQEGAVEKFVGAWSVGLFHLEGLLQESFCVGGGLFGDRGAASSTADLEDGLEL